MKSSHSANKECQNFQFWGFASSLLKYKKFFKLEARKFQKKWVTCSIAEQTKLGWVILSSGKENISTNILSTKMALYDYENLCSLDCLGVEEKHEKTNEFVYGEFRKQLRLDSVGNYKTNRKKIILHYVVIKWIVLVNYIETKNLIRSNEFGEYKKIIQEQINEGIIEKVNETKTSEKEKELYLSHRPVIRESAETT